MSTVIPAAEYRRRRRALLELIPDGAIALLPAAPARLRNRDSEYLYRQDSDFYYLTGYREPDALLVLCPGREHGEVILFCRERDARSELYDGERIGPERAVQMLGVDDAFPTNDLDDILPGMLEGRERIYVTLGDYPDFDSRLVRYVKRLRAREAGGVVLPLEFVALKHLLHEQRLYKSAAEIRLMKEAAEITCAAHRRAMAACRPGMTELALEAELVHEFMSRGARTPAYTPIVGGGENACVLHYNDNRAVLKKTDLVLIDAGCEYEHYAADVTRTFPASGSFNRTQRALYELVLEANKQAIASCQVGVLFNEPHLAALKVMIQGLIDLKLLDGDPDEVLESEAYRRFCPHNTSHWLGSDVHDVGDYRVDGAWRPLEPGMVLTIEPGIYIPSSAANEDLPSRFKGIGIRIEDDVLITAGGPDVLSASAPKEPDAVEALVGSG